MVRARLLLTALAAVLAMGCAAPVAPAASVGTPAASPSTHATAPASASPTAATQSVVIGSVTNFRDVAGSGLELPSGRTMATGVVYRSGRLTGMSAADRNRLAKAGLTAILDLRTPGVAKAAPDPSIPGAHNRLINLYAVKRVPSPRIGSVADARAYMRSIDVGFVTSGAQRERVALTLQLIASASGPVLVHCSEGKDRTGWISALLEEVAGASHEQVMAEYLKSNDYRATLIAERYRATRARSGLRAARIEQAQLKVDASYLQAGLDEVTRRYGSLDGYLTRGLGLSKGTVAALRARLVS